MVRFLPFVAHKRKLIFLRASDWTTVSDSYGVFPSLFPEARYFWIIALIVSGRTVVVETRNELKWVFAMAILHCGRMNSLVIQSYPPRLYSLSARRKMVCAVGLEPTSPRSSNCHVPTFIGAGLLTTECMHRLKLGLSLLRRALAAVFSRCLGTATHGQRQ